MKQLGYAERISVNLREAKQSAKQETWKGETEEIWKGKTEETWKEPRKHQNSTNALFEVRLKQLTVND